MHAPERCPEEPPQVTWPSPQRQLAKKEHLSLKAQSCWAALRLAGQARRGRASLSGLKRPLVLAA